MGYSLTRSFPYAAAAVLAARRYAKPAAKWRGGRKVGTALATRYSRSRTVTKRKRRAGRKGRNRYRKARRSRFKMSVPGYRLVRFKNVVELNTKWDFAYGNTASSPLRIQAGHTKWMGPSGTNPLQEAIFNSFNYKKLVKYTYSLTNLRVFLETRTTTKQQGAGATIVPAVTDVQITELPDWVFWYWRQIVSGNVTPPDKNDESQFTKFCKKNCYSAIRGFVPVTSHTNNWVTDNYAAAFGVGTTAGKYSNLDTYLQNANTTGNFGVPPGATTQFSPDIWVMPDDPYPPSFYPPSTDIVTRTSQIVVMADLCCYTTWKCKTSIV